MKLKWTLIDKNGSELPFRKATDLIDYTLRLSKYSESTDMGFKARLDVKGDPFLILREEVQSETFMNGQPIYRFEYADKNGETQTSDGTIARILYLKEEEGCTILKKTMRFEEEYPLYEVQLKAMLINRDDSEKRKMHPNSLANLKHHKQRDGLT